MLRRVFFRERTFARRLSGCGKIQTAADRGDRRALRNLQHLRKRIEVLPSKIQLRNFDQRNGLSIRSHRECLEGFSKQMHVRVSSSRTGFLQWSVRSACALSHAGMVAISYGSPSVCDNMNQFRRNTQRLKVISFSISVPWISGKADRRQVGRRYAGGR